MKRLLIFLCVTLCYTMLYSDTPPVCPIADNQGAIGVSGYGWSSGTVYNLHVSTIIWADGKISTSAVSGGGGGGNGTYASTATTTIGIERGNYFSDVKVSSSIYSDTAGSVTSAVYAGTATTTIGISKGNYFNDVYVSSALYAANGGGTGGGGLVSQSTCNISMAGYDIHNVSSVTCPSTQSSLYFSTSNVEGNFSARNMASSGTFYVSGTSNLSGNVKMGGSLTVGSDNINATYGLQMGVDCRINGNVSGGLGNIIYLMQNQQTDSCNTSRCSPFVISLDNGVNSTNFKNMAPLVITENKNQGKDYKIAGSTCPTIYILSARTLAGYGAKTTVTEYGKWYDLGGALGNVFVVASGTGCINGNGGSIWLSPNDDETKVDTFTATTTDLYGSTFRVAQTTFTVNQGMIKFPVYAPSEIGNIVPVSTACYTTCNLMLYISTGVTRGSWQNLVTGAGCP